MKSETRNRKPFLVVPHAFGFLPEIDLDKIGQLAEELEAVETVAKWITLDEPGRSQKAADYLIA
jgi:hypothetical protein